MTKLTPASQRIIRPVIAGVILLSGCIVSERSDSAKKAAADSAARVAASAAAAIPDTSDISVPAYDSVSLDTVGLGSQMGDTTPLSADSSFKLVTPRATGARPAAFPLRIPPRSVVALQLQILLDRANFSPGIIDGTWGGNAAKALEWFRVANGLDSAGSASDSSTSGSPRATASRGRRSKTLLSRASIDKAAYDKLVGSTDMSSLITSYQVTADDVKGPFVDIPNSVYDQAKLQCLCYSSPAEELAERFHTSEQLLQQLNPGVGLKTLSAGTLIQVPNLEASPPPGSPASSTSSASGPIAKIIISRKGYWTHAVDATGNIVDHFPSTLGAGYDPSPTGGFHITGISHNPAFHYQPALMAEVPDTRPTAKLAAGPNSPVGIVWMALSKPHYGIHGTSSPQTIGYANSHGCVRLTNWDAEKLATLVRAGTPVEFQ